MQIKGQVDTSRREISMVSGVSVLGSDLRDRRESPRIESKAKQAASVRSISGVLRAISGGK